MADDLESMYEKYKRKEGNGRIKALMAVIFAGVLIVALYFLVSNMLSQPANSNEGIYSALQKSANNGSYRFETGLSDTRCYWIRSTTGGAGFALEVREYDSPSKDCIGELLNKTEIPIGGPVNIMGNDCICGAKVCELENVFEGERTNLKIKGC
jgi:hypothetical protein